MHPTRPVSRRRIAISAGAAALLAPLNSTMIAVALPAIRSEFDVGVVAVTWLVTSYLVAVAITQPVGGRLADALGTLTVLRIGLGGMVVLSAAAAAAPTFELLVAARGIQGIAAALLIPSATAYLRKSVSVAELPSVLGTNGALISVGAAFGPVVGGLILAVGGWQWLFLLNLPLVLAIWVLLRPLTPDAGAGRRTFRVEPASLAALAIAFTGLALLGPGLRSDGVVLVGVALGALGGGIAMYAWIYGTRHRGVIDLNLFSKGAFSRSGAMTSLSNLVMYTTLVAMPVYLRDEHDLGDGAIGILLFAMSATNVVAAPVGARLATQYGIRTGLVTGSSVLVLSSAAVLAAVLAGGAMLLIAPLALMGVGMGLGGAAQQSSGLAAWPQSMAGAAAGTLSLMRYVGSVAGASLLAAVLGSSPDADGFTRLLAIIACVAIANAALAFIRTEAPRDVEAAVPVAAGSPQR